MVVPCGLIPKCEGSVLLWDSNFYDRRGVFINILVERGMDST